MWEIGWEKWERRTNCRIKWCRRSNTSKKKKKNTPVKTR